MGLDSQKAAQFITEHWKRSIVGELSEYIKIPNQSPAFDPNWKQNGHMDRAVQRLGAWCSAQELVGCQVSMETAESRTPLILVEIAAQAGAADRTVLFYGHLDKQPEMEGWDADKGPWHPVLIQDKLYGRGGADDGYALFSAVSAIKTLQQQNIPHCRCLILIEAGEESGSPDLPFYMQRLQTRIGRPDLIVCLDSGCENYDQLWLTTSLRGIASGELRVQLLEQGIHSGSGSGVVASSFRVLRGLLDRLENVRTGEILLPELQVNIPALRREQAEQLARISGSEFSAGFPLVNGVQPVAQDPLQLILNRTWRPALAVTGADGFPKPVNAGNVLRPFSLLKLSVRLPPTVVAKQAVQVIKKVLEADPPYNARVDFKILETAQGWQAPAATDRFRKAIETASLQYFGREAMYIGEGGSIPFMTLLSQKYPEAQFMVTGVLGPHANAHGPNEFLHLPMAKKLTGCIAHVLADLSADQTSRPGVSL